MTHEFKNIVEAYQKAKHQGLKTVLASVVALDGSSYRKPGVRMLILENGSMIGAVSGGCVEKDILQQSESVFISGQPKMMSYDGRYRLGCEGVLYILLEVFSPNNSFMEAFALCLKQRAHFTMKSYYMKSEGEHSGIGTHVVFNQEKHRLSGQINGFHRDTESRALFSEDMPPCFKLMIFGAEHDAVQLCQFAALNGWELSVYSGPMESKTIDNFIGATNFYSMAPEAIDLSSIDNQTAIMIMTHSFAKDLKYLMCIKDSNPVYIGLLGPTHKRDNLLSHLLEYHPDISDEFIEKIHGPAGLNIGAETPQEIAISIISEILALIRSQEPMHLNTKLGGIHDAMTNTAPLVK